MINLSDRLLKISEFVLDKDTLDIGADHCALLIYLIKNKKYESRFYASENKEGPYNNLVSNIDSNGLHKRITPLLGDGLDVYKHTHNAPQVIMTGMGGETIIEIIEKNKELLKSIQTLIIEPQSNHSKTRRYMHSLGFKIVEERYVKERGNFYPILRYEKGEQELSDVNAHFGILTLVNKDPVLKEKLDTELETFTEILKTVSEDKKPKIERRLGLIREALKQYE